MRRRSTGFTLIELLVVLSIIALIFAVIQASLNSTREKARDSARAVNLRSVQQALELYESDYGSYPQTDMVQQIPICDPQTGCSDPGIGNDWESVCSSIGQNPVATPNQMIPALTPAYIGTLPSDTDSNTSMGSCCYAYKSDGKDFKFMFYNCSQSAVCSGHSSLVDPVMSNTCSVYSNGASSWTASGVQ